MAKEDATAPAAAPKRWVRRAILAAVIVVAVPLAGWLAIRLHAWWNQRPPQEATTIYQGVVYGCVMLEDDGFSHGRMHWTKVDLAAPGILLYTTPLDRNAVSHGWQYKTRYAQTVAAEEGLAVVINGTFFARADLLPLPGTMARGSETVVSAHEVSHADPSSFLLWFENDLTPHLEKIRPASRYVLDRARWGIGGNLLSLYQGKVSPFADAKIADRRTLIGVSTVTRTLWLVVFERATHRRAGEELLKLGATDGVALDGGWSSEMAIGGEAVGVRPGPVMNTWIPTANHFGVKAAAITPATP